jgi:hypothetical protein
MAYIGNSPANVGNYQEVDDISGSFDGSLVTFALTASSKAISPAKSGQLLVSVNGVMQEPDDSGTNGFKVVGSNIVFSGPPASGSSSWIMFQGQNVDIGTPSDATVGTDQLSATGTKDANTYLRGDNTWVTLTGASLEAGDTYNNPNDISTNQTNTLVSTKNYMLIGDITVSGTATWTIDGTGELRIT